MGLDVSHDCWHGAYSSFAAWRAAIQEAAGKETINWPIDLPVRDVVLGWWGRDPDDVLDVLLLHSDCEGYIFPQHQEALADRLEALDIFGSEYDQKRTAQFIEGLRRAADNWEVIDFH